MIIARKAKDVKGVLKYLRAFDRNKVVTMAIIPEGDPPVYHVIGQSVWTTMGKIIDAEVKNPPVDLPGMPTDG